MGKPVILVDDAKNKQGLRIQNVPVRGTTKDIPKLVSRYGIREIIVAIPSLGTGRRMQEILELCNQTHCHTRMLSEPTDTDQSAEESTPFIRELNISDFLSRDEVELDTDSIAGYLLRQGGHGDGRRRLHRFGTLPPDHALQAEAADYL